jgi:tetrahydromethanopterin S-methyltransferase subunit B
MRYVNVEGHSNLIKDMKTGAVLNVSNDVTKARKIKENRKQRETEFDNLKDDVQNIKLMLQQIIKKMES